MSSRPLSPHLQIYKWQMTSVLSILHRMTGIALIMGICLFIMGFFCLSLSESTWIFFLDWYRSLGGFFFQWFLIFALHFHALNGIRYLIWSMGKGFDVAIVSRSGILIVFLSLFLTFILYNYLG